MSFAHSKAWQISTQPRHEEMAIVSWLMSRGWTFNWSPSGFVVYTRSAEDQEKLFSLLTAYGATAKLKPFSEL